MIVRDQDVHCLLSGFFSKPWPLLHGAIRALVFLHGLIAPSAGQPRGVLGMQWPFYSLTRTAPARFRNYPCGRQTLCDRFLDALCASPIFRLVAATVTHDK